MNNDQNNISQEINVLEKGKHKCTSHSPTKQSLGLQFRCWLKIAPRVVALQHSNRRFLLLWPISDQMPLPYFSPVAGAGELLFGPKCQNLRCPSQILNHDAVLCYAFHLIAIDVRFVNVSDGRIYRDTWLAHHTIKTHTNIFIWNNLNIIKITIAETELIK